MTIPGFSAENPGIFYAVSGLQSFILRADFKTGVAIREPLNKSSAAEERIFFARSSASKAGNIAQPLPAEAGLRMRHTPCGYTKYSAAFDALTGQKISRSQLLPI